MRILAIAQILRLLELQVQLVGKSLSLTVGQQSGQIIADGAVIVGGVREGLFRELELSLRGQGAIVGHQFFGQWRIVGRIGDDGNKAIIFRRRAHHRRSADIDILDGVVQGGARCGNGLLKRIKIHHHHIDGRDAMLSHCIHMPG